MTSSFVMSQLINLCIVTGKDKSSRFALYILFSPPLSVLKLVHLTIKFMFALKNEVKNVLKN